MAYVALAATQLIFKGRSGTTYRLGVAKDTAVGYATFSANGDSNFIFQEDVQIVDAYCGDSVNVGDYIDFYVNGLVKPTMRIYVKSVNAATTIPRCAQARGFAQDRY